jgi:hypothetical protein
MAHWLLWRFLKIGDRSLLEKLRKTWSVSKLLCHLRNVLSLTSIIESTPLELLLVRGDGSIMHRIVLRDDFNNWSTSDLLSLIGVGLLLLWLLLIPTFPWRASTLIRRWCVRWIGTSPLVSVVWPILDSLFLLIFRWWRPVNTQVLWGYQFRGWCHLIESFLIPLVELWRRRLLEESLRALPLVRMPFTIVPGPILSTLGVITSFASTSNKWGWLGWNPLILSSSRNNTIARVQTFKQGVDLVGVLRQCICDSSREGIVELIINRRREGAALIEVPNEGSHYLLGSRAHILDGDLMRFRLSYTDLGRLITLDEWRVCKWSLGSLRWLCLWHHLHLRHTNILSRSRHPRGIILGATSHLEHLLQASIERSLWSLTVQSS